MVEQHSNQTQLPAQPIHDMGIGLQDEQDQQPALPVSRENAVGNASQMVACSTANKKANSTNASSQRQKSTHYVSVNQIPSQQPTQNNMSNPKVNTQSNNMTRFQNQA